MIGGILRGRTRPRLLLDLRERGGMRGFHLTASLSHLIARRVDAEFWVIRDDHDDVSVELALLRQDSGQHILRWDPSIRQVRFALYAVMSDVMPLGATYRAARRCARHTVLGLMFPSDPVRRERGLAVLEGHDTLAFAEHLETRLKRLGRGFGFRALLGA